jgi:epoxyqueuosine reductase
LGFECVGFAPAMPPARADFFKNWLSEGKAGTMTYLNRSVERRSDPRLVLDGAKTVISVGQSYFTGRLPAEIWNDPSRGLIASYAWGRDYHEVLLAKLMQLARFVEELAPGIKTRSYTDAGPILEREFGERAGLGFIGKNTLLIAPRMGSAFFLGDILTTMDLQVSSPEHMPSCGSCSRCLDICPTHAFPAAYVLDSALCISYLTIELKGIIPVNLRAKMGNHVFGCDDCQDCCPWNLRFATETQELAYHAPLERQAPRLTDLATLSETEFKEKFDGSPVLRPRYEGFMRNVAIALGNWKSEQALPSIARLLEHSSPLVRLHAAWAEEQVIGKAEN